jgi:hypothetical protein
VVLDADDVSTVDATPLAIPGVAAVVVDAVVVDEVVVDAVLALCLEPPHEAITRQPKPTSRVCAECLTFWIELPITTPGEEGAVCAVR